jgi:hypothetical protein
LLPAVSCVAVAVLLDRPRSWRFGPASLGIVASEDELCTDQRSSRLTLGDKYGVRPASVEQRHG